MDDPVAVIVGAFGGLLVLLFLVVMFVYMPRSLYVDSECLERGYPRSSVDWKLRGYCMNLQGSVTVAVDRVTE
jgi:hypothetical protein